MTAPNPGAAVRAALLSRAETAMTATDTDRQLDELRARLRPAARSRRLRMLTAAAAVAVVGTAAGVGIARSGGSAGSGPSTVTAPTPTPSPQWQPAGHVPTGFPTGTYEHAGTFGATTLILHRNGTASVQDPRGIPTQMQMTFAAPNLVRFTETEPSATTATTSCGDHDGVYRWMVANGELTLTVVSDPCSNRQIPLSEIPWGPITGH